MRAVHAPCGVSGESPETAPESGAPPEIFQPPPLPSRQVHWQRSAAGATRPHRYAKCCEREAPPVPCGTFPAFPCLHPALKRWAIVKSLSRPVIVKQPDKQAKNDQIADLGGKSAEKCKR